MRYTAYVALNAALCLIIFVFFAAIASLFPAPASIALVLFIGLVLLIGFGMSVAWAHRAVSEFGGSPFPGIWGVLGFDIEPDEGDDTQPFGTRPWRSRLESSPVTSTGLPVEPPTNSGPPAQPASVTRHGWY